MIDDLLSDEAITNRNLFKPSSVRRLVANFDSGKEDLSLHLFQLLTLELWFREFIDK
jgi:asparagine synthase (glutamine-hydrolysing)